MKHSTCKAGKSLTLVLAACAFVFGCAPDDSQFSSRTFRIPFPDDSGLYALRDIELKSYSDPLRFRGDAAQIFVEPHEDNGQLTGEEPVGRYVRSGGVSVPSDFDTLEATTVYAHMERLKAIDEELGSASSIRWPLRIGVQTNIVDQGNSVNNNALYDGRLDALMIVPYTGAGLPIAMNAGVLGHEHFHSIFQSLVLSKVKEQSIAIGKPSDQQVLFDHDTWAEAPEENPETPKPSPRPIVIKSVAVDDDETTAAAESMTKRTYNAFLLRAVNEGLADFWGWVYTGEDSYIMLSLPGQGGVRRLDLESGRLPDGKLIRTSLVDLSQPDKIRTASQRVSLAYVLGTQYARFLRATAREIIGDKKPTFEARKAVARAVLDILPSIGQLAADSYDRDFMSPNFILKPLTLRLGTLSEDTCARISLFKADDKTFDSPASCQKSTSTSTGGVR